MNSMIFQTGGDWDSTTLFNNGQEVMAAQLYVELHAGRDGWGDPDRGGIYAGGDISAFVRTQDEPDEEWGIFPGRLEMDFPGHSLVIENTHPGFEFECTRVLYNGEDVTAKVVDVVVNIDADNNVVQAYITVYRPHFLAADEIATYTII
jgi:hypothetical protein